MNQDAPDYEAIFTKPTAPRSDWETFKWMFFEPSLLQKYSREITRKEAAVRFLKVYFFFITPLILLCWLLFVTGLTWVDVPTKHPEFFKFDLTDWSALSDFISKWIFLAKTLAFGLAVGLALGLALGLTFGLAAGLIFGLAAGLAFALALGLSLGLAGLAYSLIFSLAFGFGLALIFGLILSLVVALAFGLGGGLGFSLAFGLAGGLGFITGFHIAHFRLLFHPFYWLGILGKQNLTSNPYLHDEGIWLPLPWVKLALLKHAKEQPALALQLVNFLLRYRKLQRGLAYEIEHTAVASHWQRLLRLNVDAIYRYAPSFFTADNDDSTLEKWRPSVRWQEKISALLEYLLVAESQTAVVLKKQYLKQCAELLSDFEAIHLRETFKGRDAYFPVIEHWQKILDNQIREVNQEVERIHSVTLNPYSKGNALSPDTVNGNNLFLEREDLKSELLLKIQTSATMPTFLILGQRRTGKTSLLNFLSQLLDKSRYAVAVIDAQSMSGELSVSNWLNILRERVIILFDVPHPEYLLPLDWLEAWEMFANSMMELAKKFQRKIILVMDEYDETFGFHNALRQDPERGAQLLARIRAFSQRQNEVVLLFVGATGFRDLLGEPSWTKYFVQIHIFRVEYLSRAGSLHLITHPVPDFRLQYADGLPERIWELTQGHPHLLHSICSDLVDYANIVPKNPVDHADLDKILAEKTLQSDEQPFVGFWSEFCQSASMREAVLHIIHHRPVDKSLPEVRRLLDYKYVVENAEGMLRMRVPLFEQWLLKFGY